MGEKREILGSTLMIELRGKRRIEFCSKPESNFEVSRAPNSYLWVFCATNTRYL